MKTIVVIVSSAVFALVLTTTAFSYPLSENDNQLDDEALLDRQPRAINFLGIEVVRKLFALKRAGKFDECREECDKVIEDEIDQFESDSLRVRAFPRGKDFEPKRRSCYRMCPGERPTVAPPATTLPPPTTQPLPTTATEPTTEATTVTEPTTQTEPTTATTVTEPTTMEPTTMETTTEETTTNNGFAPITPGTNPELG